MKLIVILSVLITLSACSSLPDLKVGYYQPKSLSVITVNHTIACKNPKSWKHAILSDIDIKEVVTVDKSSIKYIELNEIDAWYSKSDIEISLKDDGRLSSINSSNSSHIVDYLDKVTKIATKVFTTKALSPPHLCRYVSMHPEAKFDDDSGIYLLSLKLQGGTDFTNIINIKPVNFTKDEYKDYKNILGDITASYTNTENYADVQFLNTSSKHKKQNVEFKIPLLVKIDVAINSIKGQIKKSRIVEVPQLSEKYYKIPIPSAPLFGNNGFALTINDKSKITKLKYSSDNSASSGVDALDKLYSLKETDAEELTRITTEIDLIRAKETRAKCELDSSQC